VGWVGGGGGEVKTLCIKYKAMIWHKSNIISTIIRH